MPAPTAIATPDAPLAADRLGGGAPVLLLHGIGTTRADVAKVAGRLAGRFDVLAVDLPGHGGSPPLDRPATVPALADAIEADLDARGLGTVHVVGNSLGGRLALELARRGRARSVVAIAPSGMGLPAERLGQVALLVGGRLGLRALGGLVSVGARIPAGRAALLAPLRAHPWAADADEALMLREGLATGPGFWEALPWAVFADVPLGLEAIRCPVTLVQGLLDRIAPGHAARFLALIPGARLEWLPDAGHSAQGDRPREVARIVRETAARAAG